MKITTEIAALFASLRAKVGAFESDIESHFENFIDKAKAEEAAAEAKIATEVAHLESLGYHVDKPVATPVAPVADVPAADASTLVGDASASPAAAPVASPAVDPSAM